MAGLEPLLSGLAKQVVTWFALATTNTPWPDFDPATHASMQAEAAPSEDMDAHGTSPWAEGPRDDT
jgi:hypothetical protein